VDYVYPSVDRFRLISLQLTELRKCHSLDELEMQLKSLPNGLREMYDRMALMIDHRHRADVGKILRWLSFSLRPLELIEVAQVVGFVIDPEHGPCFKPSRLYQDPQYILHVCSSFVTSSEGKLNFL
jgi:hypothetical protein